MKWLVDNNVLLAALDSANAHHKHARLWLDAEKKNGWAVTIETYLNVIRKLTNEAVMKGNPLKPPKAVEAVRNELDNGPHPGRIISGEQPDDAILKKAQGGGQINDFYLVQLAMTLRMQLATIDHRLVNECANQGWQCHVVLV